MEVISDINGKILAGIVLYNPDLVRLQENITAIYNQVDKVYLFDNGSDNICETKELLNDFPRVLLIESLENIGIAAALNRLVSTAKKDGINWLLTLDQDSIVPVNIISEYKKYVNVERLGMICCKILDRNFGEKKQEKEHATGVEEVELCITSASAINVYAWEEVGGYCEDMFIDGVDFDICLSLKEYGYKVLRINDVELLHEVGHGRKVSLFWKEELIFNHNPLRCYYMIRNNVLLGNRHNQLLRQLGLAIKRILLINIYEKNRWCKNIMMFIGLWHAIIGRYGKYVKE